jgi:uncharacterized RDD family membrane protein YckC
LEHPKADIGTRLIAALIDGALSSVVSMLIPVLGAIVATVYMFGKDGLFDGRSVGKKVMKLQVMTESGAPATYADSAKRNAIFALPYVLMIIPVLGWVVAHFIGLAIVIVELVLLISDPKGKRIGDKWAGTQVIKAEESTQASA